jgi:hypothetical protein
MYNPEYTDPYGTELYETDEERRRRLAAEAEANMPTKQTITYDNKTGAQKVKIEGSATNLSAMNPATPTVAGPVAPEDIYNRMIQAESGGRQFGPGGQVLTSPAGAMGVGQVMPATAAQPGYGVTNIFDLAQQRGVPVPSRDVAGAQQLLGNEQLNREFGQNYYNAMQQRFGTPGGVAAYNAGPGRVGQNLQANQGQLNTSQLPDETQAYIQRVLGKMPGYVPGQPTGQAAIDQTPAQQPQPIINDQGQVVGQETPAQMVAGAQANAPIAQGPVAPQAQPQMVQTQAAPSTMPEQMGPSTQFMSRPGWIERFNTAQGDIGTLSSMLADPNLPKGAQMEIAANMADQMRFQKMENEKREQYTRGIETGNFRQLERDDRKTDGGGSWLRYFMYGLMGSPNAAIEKQRLMPELYAKPDYVTLPDGQTQVVIMRDDNGNAIRGTTADGRALTQKELIQASALAVPLKGSQVGTTTFIDPVTKETLSKVDTMRGPVWYNKAQQRVIPKGEPIPNTIGGNLQIQGELADFRIREAIIKKGLTNVQDAKKDYISKNGPFGTSANPMSEQDFERIHSGQLNQLQAAPRVGPAPATQPAAGAPTASGAGPAPGAQPAPVAQPAPATGGGYVTEAVSKGREEIVKNSADVLKDEPNMIAQINSGNKVIDILDNKKTNFGSILQGQLPGEQFIGKALGTTDARNTQKVMEYLDKVTATGAKALGANPTDRDLKFLLENRPNERWPAADVKDWIESTQEKIKESIEVARKQVQTGGTYQPPVPATGGTGAKPAGVKGGSGTKEDPYKL